MSPVHCAQSIQWCELSALHRHSVYHNVYYSFIIGPSLSIEHEQMVHNFILSH